MVMQIVLIKWRDSSAAGGAWEDKSFLDDMKLKDCESVGFITEKEDYVILHQSQGDNSILNEICIPRGCITGIEVLK